MILDLLNVDPSLTQLVPFFPWLRPFMFLQEMKHMCHTFIQSLTAAPIYRTLRRLFKQAAPIANGSCYKMIPNIDLFMDFPPQINMRLKG